GAPGGQEIDVVALACTHFPLLAEELERAAPRPILWLDSGDAIARRVGNLLIADEGSSQVRVAGLTAPDTARGLYRAFHARGFTDLVTIGPAPDFTTAPLKISAPT